MGAARLQWGCTCAGLPPQSCRRQPINWLTIHSRLWMSGKAKTAKWKIAVLWVTQNHADCLLNYQQSYASFAPYSTMLSLFLTPFTEPSDSQLFRGLISVFSFFCFQGQKWILSCFGLRPLSIADNLIPKTSSDNERALDRHLSREKSGEECRTCNNTHLQSK